MTAKSRIYKVIPRQSLSTAAVASASAASGPRNHAKGVGGGGGGGVDGSSKKVAAAGGGSGGGASGGASASGGVGQYELRLVLEENAKWGLAADVRKEIRDLHKSRARCALYVVYTCVTKSGERGWFCCLLSVRPLPGEGHQH